MKPQPTELNYNLKCRVEVKEVTYKDIQSKGETLSTEKFVYLIPEQSTQRDLFLDAWYPDTQEQVYELGLRAGHPINGPFRGCIKRANTIINEPHIFVMSRGAEEDFKAMVRSAKGFFSLNKKVRIDIEVLGEQQEELVDHQKDFELRDKKDFSHVVAVK